MRQNRPHYGTLVIHRYVQRERCPNPQPPSSILHPPREVRGVPPCRNNEQVIRLIVRNDEVIKAILHIRHNQHSLTAPPQASYELRTTDWGTRTHGDVQTTAHIRDI